jgi:hypothetical protein
MQMAKHSLIGNNINILSEGKFLGNLTWEFIIPILIGIIIILRMEEIRKGYIFPSGGVNRPQLHLLLRVLVLSPYSGSILGCCYYCPHCYSNCSPRECPFPPECPSLLLQDLLGILLQSVFRSHTMTSHFLSLPNERNNQTDGSH